MIQTHAPLDGKMSTCQFEGCKSGPKMRGALISHFQTEHCTYINNKGIKSVVQITDKLLQKRDIPPIPVSIIVFPRCEFSLQREFHDIEILLKLVGNYIDNKVKGIIQFRKPKAFTSCSAKCGILKLWYRRHCALLLAEENLV